MNQLCIDDITSINLSTTCDETWPCRHGLTITLKNGQVICPKAAINVFDVIWLFKLSDIAVDDLPAHIKQHMMDPSACPTQHIDHTDRTFVYE